MFRERRLIVRNGHSTHVSLPPKMLEYLRWRPGDFVVLEVIDVNKLVVRQATLSDLRAPGLPAPAQPELVEAKA